MLSYFNMSVINANKTPRNINNMNVLIIGNLKVTFSKNQTLIKINKSLS